MPSNKEGSPNNRDYLQGSRKIEPYLVLISEDRKKAMGEFSNSVRDRASITHMR